MEQCVRFPKIPGALDALYDAGLVGHKDLVEVEMILELFRETFSDFGYSFLVGHL